MNMNEFITTANGLIALITALASLIATGISIFVAVKQILKNAKNKTLADNWVFIQNIAKAAMEKAEETGAAGADKKKMVIEAVKAGCLEAGVDIAPFVDQLDAFINNSITFVNSLNNLAK